MNKHSDLSDYPQDEQQAVGGRVEPVVSCDLTETLREIKEMIVGNTYTGKLLLEIDGDDLLRFNELINKL